MTREETGKIDAIGAQVDMLVDLVREMRGKLDEFPDKYATKDEVNRIKLGWPPAVTYILTPMTALLTWALTRAFVR